MNTANTHPIALPLADWHTLITCVSDEVDGAVVAGDPRGIVGLADSIRDTAPARTGDTQHTPDKPAAVALTLDQAALAFALLDKWADVDERLGNHDDAAQQRRIRDRIGAAMATVPDWPQTRDSFLDPGTLHNHPAPEPDLTGMPPAHPGADRGVTPGSRGRIPPATAHLYQPVEEPDTSDPGDTGDTAEAAAHPHGPPAAPDPGDPGGSGDAVKDPWAATLEELTRQRRQQP